MRFQGPINARLYVDSLSGGGMLSVAVEDVAPDGTVTRLTGGWQVVADRALDTTKSRYLDGKLVQPFHPFTKAAEKPLPAGAVEPVDVEVFPTGASIEKGHRLRIAVQAFDTPHLTPTLTQLPGDLTVAHDPQLRGVPVGADPARAPLSRPVSQVKNPVLLFTHIARCVKNEFGFSTWETADPCRASDPGAVEVRVGARGGGAALALVAGAVLLRAVGVLGG